MGPRSLWRERGSGLSKRQGTIIVSASKKKKRQKILSSPKLCSKSHKKPCWKLMFRRLKKPTTTAQGVMDGESHFIIIRLLGIFFWISWEERCQGHWKSKLTKRRIADDSGRKQSLWEMDQTVVRPVIPTVIMKTCLSKTLDQSSLGFW